MDIGGWINGAINATSNAIGTIGSLVQNKRNFKKQMAFNREENQKNRDWNLNLAKMQNQWNIDQWNAENVYNTPSAVMARLKAGGLNPDLMYGEGAGSQLSASSPEMTSGQGSQPTSDNAFNNLKTIGEIMAQNGSLGMQNAQIGVLNAQADKIKAETTGADIQNQSLGQMLTTGIKLSEATIREKLANANLSDKEVEVKTQQILNMQQSIEESKVKMKDLESQITNRTVQQAQNFLQLQINKKVSDAQIKELASKTSWNYAQVKRAVSLLPYEITNLISSSNLNDNTSLLRVAESILTDVERHGKIVDTNIKNSELRTRLRGERSQVRAQAAADYIDSNTGGLATAMDVINYALGAVVGNIKLFGK